MITHPHTDLITKETEKLFRMFFGQCRQHCPGAYHNFINIPFEKMLFIHAIKEDSHYKVPCIIQRCCLTYSDPNFVHPKNFEALVNITNSISTIASRFLESVLDSWRIACQYSSSPLRFTKKSQLMHAGSGFLLDNTGKPLMLTTVDICTKSTMRCVRYKQLDSESGEWIEFTEDVRTKQLYVSNPTLFIHPEILTERKWTRLREWIVNFVIPVCQNMAPFNNSDLGSQAVRKMNHKISIVFKPMDQFFSKPKEAAVTEDVSDEMNSLIPKNIDHIDNIFS